MSFKLIEGPDSLDFVRLHVTPFDAHLLKVVVPNSLLPLARNISYHEIETFPEKRFGFIDLPAVEADKLKKKLNGATLRGVRMKIEKARAEDWISREEEAREAEKEENKKPKRKSKAEAEGEGSAPKKKRKREQDVLDGVVLKDRKVKRGWTETPAEARENKKTKKSKAGREDAKKGKPRTKSKHTENHECLLKVHLPPNAVQNLSQEAADKLKRRKKKKGKEREITVHEFENMSGFPGFLKGSVVQGGHTAVEYAEGKGWVNEKGDVVEAAKESKRPSVKKAEKIQKQKAVSEEHGDELDDTSSSGGTSSSGSDSSSVEESEEKTLHPKKSHTRQDSVGKSSISSSPESNADEIQTAATPSRMARPSSSSSARPLSITIPPPPTTPAAVHPLEALYKRKSDANDDPDSNATAAASKDEPFSFFGGGHDSDLELEKTPNPNRPHVPMTPFTKQDFEWRNIRSAAPTPDTAHPSRIKNFWAESNPEDDAFAPLSEYQQDETVEENEGDEEDEGEGEVEDEGSRAGNGTSGATPSSDFQTWFWENRRDLNKTWMQRRKTAAKEKRHRENKARASRAV